MPRIFAIVMCVWGSTAIAATAARPNLDDLMRLLARRRHGEVTYVEKDYLAVLERPLRSSGVLIYDAPDHLEKRTLRPKAESVVLDHGEVTLQRGRRTVHLDLGSYPQVAPYVDAVRATMAGDRAALERVFQVSFAGNLQHWRLGLVPRDEKTARDVRRISIEGAEGNVRSVEIDEANGDRSVMTLGAAPPAVAPASVPASAPKGSPGI